jgi:phosphatidylserine/phosphatidylglycerophosphate/cardiolipin synthase-like enzyme
MARATDLDAATSAMEAYILDPSPVTRAQLAATGVDTGDARDFLRLVPRESEAARDICGLARAWALGRSSVGPEPSWQPVITSGEVDLHGVDRMTAETMIGLIVGARTHLRIFSPFLDAAGMDVLTVALVAATRRGVRTAIGYASGGSRREVIAAVEEAIGKSGNQRNLRAVGIESHRPFPHLKLIAADGERAYIGSANLTWPALTSNAEVGALVEGEPVSALERWFDALLGPELSSAVTPS